MLFDIIFLFVFKLYHGDFGNRLKLMFLELQLLSLQFKNRNNVLGFNLILEEIVKTLWFGFVFFPLHQMLVDHFLLQRLKNLQEVLLPPPQESQKLLKPRSPQN